MITADYINDLCTRSHAMAKEKGWWDENRSPYELGNLCHSELSEALEELRDGREVTEIYFKPDKPTKPEGFPTELADFVIRLADWAASSGEMLMEDVATAINDGLKTCEHHDIQAEISELHGAVRVSVDAMRGTWTQVHTLYASISLAFFTAEGLGIDLPAAIEQKMAYNATRPIRHGRKF